MEGQLSGDAAHGQPQGQGQDWQQAQRFAALVGDVPAFGFESLGLIGRGPAVDATGAGDCFVGAITVALLEGMDPAAALTFACAAGAIAATRPGAQPSMPTRAEVEAILSAS